MAKSKGSKVIPGESANERGQYPFGYESGARKGSGGVSMFPDKKRDASKNRTNASDGGHGKPSL